MAASGVASNLAPTVFVVAVVIALLVRRTVAMVRGTVYSPARLFGFAGFYAAVFALLAVPTVYAAAHVWGLPGALLPVPYAAVAVAAAELSAPHVRRTVRFERRPDGSWFYRMPGVVPILVVVFFAIRFGIEVGVLGLFSGSGFVLASSLPPTLLYVLVGVDLLFGTSVGLLLGRAFGVYRAFEEKTASAESTPAPPQRPAGQLP